MPPTLTLDQLAQVATYLYATPFIAQPATSTNPSLLGTLHTPDRTLTVAQDETHLYIARPGTHGQTENETLTELFAESAERLF